MDTEKAIEGSVVPGARIINETDVPNEVVAEAVFKATGDNPHIKRVFDAAFQWGNMAVGSSRRGHGPSLKETRPGGIGAQNKYVAPSNIYDQFRLADIAVSDDDILGGAADFTEQFAFREVAIESGSDEENSIWRQITEDDLDLESNMRIIWRDIFTYSTSYVAVLWGKKTYKVEGKTASGKRSKKQFRNILVPTKMTTLDPLSIVPWGNFMFGEEDLYYIAPLNNLADLHKVVEERIPDYMGDLIEGPSNLSPEEETEIGKMVGGGSVVGRLFKLKKENVFRITATRPHYKPFADLRLRSVFELLDLKHNMREMDRADILGSLNALIVVKLGSKDEPATQEEADHTTDLLQGSARVPIIVGDYNLDVQIITRRTDTVLRPERYNNLDSRITSRIFQILASGSYNSGTGLDDSTKLSRVIAASMEARRDDIRKGLMRNVFMRVYQRNDQFEERPVMNFYPKRIDIDFNHHFATQIFDMFMSGTLSRETLLSELGFDIRVEADRLEQERELYGIFSTREEERIRKGLTSNVDAKVGGRVGGGNNNGGGDNQTSYTPTRDADD